MARLAEMAGSSLDPGKREVIEYVTRAYNVLMGLQLQARLIQNRGVSAAGGIEVLLSASRGWGLELGAMQAPAGAEEAADRLEEVVELWVDLLLRVREGDGTGMQRAVGEMVPKIGAATEALAGALDWRDDHLPRRPFGFLAFRATGNEQPTS